MAQVHKNAYQFGSYSGVHRFASYAYQLQEILAVQPQSVLEIGVGEGVVGRYIQANTPIAYTSVDFATDLSPDVIADVRALPFGAGQFDVVCAFEVLEHLPFEEFDRSVCELARVSRRRVLISLPHFGPPVKFLLKVPFLPEIRFAYKVPGCKRHVFNGQHYWEIGKCGYPLSRIRAVLRKHGIIRKEFVPFENQYHHFFIMEV